MSENVTLFLDITALREGGLRDGANDYVCVYILQGPEGAAEVVWLPGCSHYCCDGNAL